MNLKYECYPKYKENIKKLYLESFPKKERFKSLVVYQLCDKQRVSLVHH